MDERGDKRPVQKMPARGAGFSSSTVVGRIKQKKTKDYILGQLSPSLHKYSFLLLTSAVGIDIVLTKLGSPYIGQAVSGILVFLYLLNFVSLRKAMTSFWSAVMDIFFREISVGGINKLEPLEDGRAVIFACAPHVNQFIDPILVMKAVAESTGRHVSWMAAQKSFDRKAIGAMATALKAIPVVRPDDLERKGKGFITCRGVQVYGHAGTAFTRDFVKGALLVVKTNEGKCTAKVVKVFDDFHMEIAEPGLTRKKVTPKKSETIKFERVMKPSHVACLLLLTFAPLVTFAHSLVRQEYIPVAVMVSLFIACAVTNSIYLLVRDGFSGKELFGGVMTHYSPGGAVSREIEVETSVHGPSIDLTDKTAYSLQPFVDQTDMFDSVFTSLVNGGTIGIFPEGGTHDGTTLLPLKWGISVMLLGSMAKQEGVEEPIKISVVPVGLNYFSPHKFRSTVSIDFGDPIEIHQDLAMQWKHGSKEEKQTINKAVMELIMAGVNSCTLQATDFNTLEVFRMIRRLYVPSGMRLSVADNVALTAGIAKSFQNVVHEDKSVQDIMERTHKYNLMLSTYHVDDRHVQRYRRAAFSSTDRVRLLCLTALKLLHLLLFGCFLFPWMLCAAPVSLLLSVGSDQKAKEVQKMSVKGTWKVLLAPIGLIGLHSACSIAIAMSFGEIAVLVWFFFAPVGAMYAIVTFEDGIKVIKSLNALLTLGWKGDIGQQLFETREQLKKDIRSVKNRESGRDWLVELEPGMRKRFSASQSFAAQSADDVEVATSLGSDSPASSGGSPASGVSSRPLRAPRVDKAPSLAKPLVSDKF